MEDKERIKQIKKLAHKVNVTLNLFEGYLPKKVNDKSSEVRFWREIVNIYSIFCDCDRVQIKERKNLFELFYRYSLIEREQYEHVKKLYLDISDLRAWFCHNNTEGLYYPEQRRKRIKLFLNKAFVLATNKPISLDEIQDKDWELITYYIHNEFMIYLDILESGLKKWGESEAREKIDEEWMDIFAVALFNDQELRENVLFVKYELQLREQGIPVKNIYRGVENYKKQLEVNNYSSEDIKEVLKECEENIMSSIEIIKCSLDRICLEI